jgi:cytochrome c
MKRPLLVFIIILAVVFVFSCSKAATTTTPATTTPAGSTFGSLSQAGQTVFTNVCTVCHGASGQGGTGPALIGSGSNLAKYNTAKGLLDFISTAMPQNAPGSLSHPDYLSVLSYLLVQNNFASPTTAFNEGDLANIALK